MEIYEGTVFYDTGKACLMVESTQEKFLLMLKGKRIEKTSQFLINKGIVEGKRVSITGQFGYNPELENISECKKTLIFDSNAIKEI